LENTWKTFKNFVEIWESLNTDRYYHLLSIVDDYDDIQHISECYIEGIFDPITKKIEIDFSVLELKIQKLEKN